MSTILIHEPDAVIALHLNTILKNYQVVRSNSFSSLFKSIRNQKFDLLIIDVSKIIGWTHLIRFISRFAPVIVLTSQSEYYFKRSQRNKFNMIEMPFNSADILNAVKNYQLEDDN